MEDDTYQETGEICAKCGTEILADEKPVRHGDSVICQECAKAENVTDG